MAQSGSKRKTRKPGSSLIKNWKEKGTPSFLTSWGSHSHSQSIENNRNTEIPKYSWAIKQ